MSSRTPLIRQSEVSECGLACLAMIAHHHGHEAGLPALRRRFPMSLRGAALPTLLEMGRGLGLGGRVVRVDLGGLARLRFPAVLHWDMNHFVVATGVRGDRVTVLDPERGKATWKLDEISSHFTGIAIEWTPTPAFEKCGGADRLRLLDVVRAVPGFMRDVLPLLLATVLLQGLALAAPLLTQLAVDTHVRTFDPAGLLPLVAIFAGLLLLQVVTNQLRGHVAVAFGSRLTEGFSLALFERLLRLPMGFFLNHRTGDLLVRFKSIAPIRSVLSEDLVALVMDGLLLGGAAIALFGYSWSLALIPLCTAALLVGARKAAHSAQRRSTEDLLCAQARESTSLIETLRSIQSIRLFGKAAERQSQWHSLFQGVVDAEWRLGALRVSRDSVQMLLVGLQALAATYFLASAVIGGSLTLGMLFAFLLYARMFADRAVAVTDRILGWRLVDLHLDRLADIVRADADPEFADGDADVTPYTGALEGGLELRDLAFDFGFGQQAVFANLSARVAPGECVVVMGPSGAGKSTLLKIIAGLLRPSGGEVCYDGATAASIGWSRLRSRIGVVLQEDELLSGSIADNITFFASDPDEDRVRKVAAAVTLDRDIAKFPMGYETLVGESGLTLSGGQIQRLLLARALYREPTLLLVDEGTAHVDSANEHDIIEHLGRLPATRILVSHRQELRRIADQVWTIADGRLTVERLRPVRRAPDETLPCVA
jgi:ATP-binding cassette subfamily B protein RaxB